MLRVAAAVALTALSISPAFADPITIVDTGVGPFKAASKGALSVAGEFTVTDSLIVTSLESYLSVGKLGVPVPTIFALYSDGGEVPGTLLFSETFIVQSDDEGTHAWQGPTTLNWLIGPGTYWAAVEADQATSLQVAHSGAAVPLANYATAFLPEGTYAEQDNIDVPFRIQGVQAVPEPASILLAATGLTSVALVRRRRRQQ